MDNGKESMKTYSAATQKPLLEIVHDNDSESPRSWDNLGYFVSVGNNFSSPDKGEIYNIVVKTGGIAESEDEHMRLIKAEINEQLGEKVLAIYPVMRYEHTDVAYSLGRNYDFDFSNNGFYIVTDKTAKVVGTPKKLFRKVIEQELEVYNKWVNGEVYGFMLYDEDGELEASCFGFYDLEDIRGYLSPDWKDEDLSQYIN